SFLRESRRLSNTRIKRELGLKLTYPTVADGIAAARQQAAPEPTGASTIATVATTAATETSTQTPPPAKPPRKAKPSKPAAGSKKKPARKLKKPRR
ncbi:MAG TPA: hypothetical protein VN028_06180, partial [Rhodocyclaceae bacterium]|nr:hypothetical protein [Rhodocyclaceae bacterium]